ncbi:glycosyltransferase [Ammoniphilus oxalaticus]|uniref:glycosyltransferase n=1 Tax=Ammoniphilus oxalaticus TaxID=66863 RepID=UPI0014759AA8|nr:glycosyltransferase [Ammoniphilus oxalaticus]
MAVIRSNFLPPTETFIYEELKRLKRYRAYVLAKKRSNRKKFPYPRVTVINKKKGWRHYLRKNKIDLIHARFGHAGIDLLDTKRKTGLPMITSFHGHDNPRNRKNRKKYRNLKKLFRHGEKFTVTNRQMGRILREYGCPKRKIHVQHSGIDLAKFRFKARKRPKKGPIKILYVGRFVEKKGAKYLVRAFKRVTKRVPNVKLTMIGDGSQRNQIKRLVRKLGLSKKVNMIRTLPHQQVVKQMRHTHLFCLPSVTGKNRDQEGIPNVLKEAMASGVPVISTRHAGIPELVTHKKTGFLVRERDSKALAKMLLYVIRRPNKWKGVGIRARRKIARDFDSRKQTARLERLYDEVLRNRKRKKKKRKRGVKR